MAVLESCAKHNMVAYLEKTDGNTDFHEIIDFLTRSSIHYALTVSPVVSTTFVEQFWMSAKSKIINNVRYITAKVAGKPVNISEASIRSDLLFDDADGIDSLHSHVIFDAIKLMGNLDAKKKFVMYPRFISVFLDKQLKNVHVPLDHFPINALTSKVFFFMVKKGKHFSGNVTPLFESMLVQPTEDEGEASERQFEPQPTPSPPHPSADQYETQPDPSPRPSPTILDSILEGSGGNHRDQAKEIKHLKAQIKTLKKKAKAVITHHKAWMKSVSMKQRLVGNKSLKTKWMQKESVSKQGRKPAKAEPTVHKDPAFDDLDDIVDDAMDYMESEDAQDEGRTSSVVLEEKESTQKGVSTEVEVSTVKPDEGTDKSKVSTDKPEVSTAKPKEVEVSTDKLDEGTAEPKDGTSDESTAPTTVFRDDETIAEFLVSMSQNKAKQKGVEIKDAEDSDRPRATSTRSVLTLKPLPKIDPKDKGKKVLEEEAESDAESEGVDEAERKFDQLAKDEEIARKLEANAELVKDVLGKDMSSEDYAKRMVDMINQKKKYYVEQKAKLKQETSKKQKIAIEDVLEEKGDEPMKEDDEAEEDMEAIEKGDSSSGTDILVNPVLVDIKPPSIANWKIINLGKKGVYQIVRENGTDKIYISFGAMLKDISRDDLTELYRLVMQRYGTNRPEDEYERVFWRDLKTMFDPPLSTDLDWNLPDKKLQGDKRDEACLPIVLKIIKKFGNLEIHIWELEGVRVLFSQHHYTWSSVHHVLTDIKNLAKSKQMALVKLSKLLMVNDISIKDLKSVRRKTFKREDDLETINYKDIVEKPKTVRPSAPIIEDWDTNSDNDTKALQRAATSLVLPGLLIIDAPKSKVNDALPKTYSYFKAHSPVRRAFNQKSAAKTNNLNEKVKNMAKGNPQYTLQDQGIFNSGYSRHMTGNKSFHTNYQEIDGGFVTFRGSPKKVKLLEKVKLGLVNNFEDVYFVKELKFNLFFVSQMCDNKNITLFTETKCLVLSFDFKLLDESQVLLKVPRHDNMYSFDLKNVVPSGVAERKNKTLIEAAKTMLADSLLPTTFCAEAVNTACYVQNRVLVSKPYNKTPYELLH
ncbi:ribonuclease H-like domain-containing protein, partial [Tanacetum coccineum]